MKSVATVRLPTSRVSAHSHATTLDMWRTSRLSGGVACSDCTVAVVVDGFCRARIEVKRLRLKESDSEVNSTHMRPVTAIDCLFATRAMDCDKRRICGVTTRGAENDAKSVCQLPLCTVKSNWSEN